MKRKYCFLNTNIFVTPTFILDIIWDRKETFSKYAIYVFTISGLICIKRATLYSMQLYVFNNFSNFNRLQINWQMKPLTTRVKWSFFLNSFLFSLNTWQTKFYWYEEMYINRAQIYLQLIFLVNQSVSDRKKSKTCQLI